MERAKSYLKTNGIIITIITLGLGLRLWGIGYGLPYTYVADEPSRILVSLNMLRTGDLNPYWLGYPHLMFYLNTFALLIYFWIAHLIGMYDTPMDIPLPEVVTIGVGKLVEPSLFLVSRGLTVLMGTGAIILVYLIGCQVSRRRSVGLLAALFFAVSPAGVLHSQMISLDMYGVFFLLLAFLWIDALNDEQKVCNYIKAGIGIGLAFSGKYNVGIIGISFVITHLLLYGWRGIKQYKFYLALLASALTFAAVNPYSILDLQGFIHGLGMASESQSQYAGTGSSFQWYVIYLWSVEGWVTLFGVLGAVGMVWNRSRRGLALLSFPIAYVILVSQFPVHNDRTILPVIPFLDVLAALFIVSITEKAQTLWQIQRSVTMIGLAVLSGLSVIVPLQTAITLDLRLTSVDGRETARRWLEANLPTGSRVAVEGYSPYLDTRRFVVSGHMSMIEHPPAWYVQNGFEYLVFSQGIYGRFFDDPAGYAPWIAQYKEFFAHFPQVARFDDNGFEIRVHKTNVTLPSHRIAARFGDYGELIELVGYDTTTPRVQPGESLHVRLFWRALKPANEPLELSLHLLNRDNQVTTVRGDLFQHKYSGWAWPEGIFSTEWTVPISANVEPGMYTLQVEVTQTRFAYTLPARTWAGELIPAVSLGMFKVGVPAPSAAELQAAHKTNVRWNDQIELIAYALDSRTTRAGDTLNITLYWRSIAKSDKEYTIFVHLLDAQGNVRAQRDAPPRNGAYPTSIWDVGEIVRDEYALELPRDLVAGEYRLVVGLYEYPSLARLSVTDTTNSPLGDQFVLDEIIRITP